MTAPVADTYPWLADPWSGFVQRLEQGRMAHALLIEGPAQTGKMKLARAMAARLLCKGEAVEGCGQCRSCQLLVGGAHPDFFDLQPDPEKQVIRVDQVREMTGKLDLTTSISDRKVALIHPADRMNAASANALLKSLEEPAGDTVLLLVTSHPAALPVTIRSRCQSVAVRQPGEAQARAWLAQRTAAEGVTLEDALQAAGGSPLLACEYLDSPQIDAFKHVREGLGTLLQRPASVSVVCEKLLEIDAEDLWRWLSLSVSDAARQVITGQRPEWLPGQVVLGEGTLLELQRQADRNRRLSTTPVRPELLLQDWLIRWAQQAI